MFSNKNHKYNNFIPINIFKKDEDGNNIYFQWGEYGKGYIVNDSQKQAKLVDLEGYKHFIFSYKPPILIPIILLSVLISAGLYYLTDYKLEIRDSIVSITFLIYLIVVIFYILKIRNVLKNCKSISQKSKEQIYKDI